MKHLLCVAAAITVTVLFGKPEREAEAEASLTEVEQEALVKADAKAKADGWARVTSSGAGEQKVSGSPRRRAPVKVAPSKVPPLNPAPAKVSLSGKRYIYAGTCSAKTGWVMIYLSPLPKTCAEVPAGKIAPTRGTAIRSDPKSGGTQVGQLAIGTEVEVLSFVQGSRYPEPTPQHIWAELR